MIANARASPLLYSTSFELLEAARKQTVALALLVSKQPHQHQHTESKQLNKRSLRFENVLRPMARVTSQVTN